MGVTFKGLKETQRAYERAATTVARAEARAVQRVGTSIRAEQVRQMAKTVNVKTAALREAVEIKSQPTPERPRVVFQVRGRGISLINFGGRGSWKGASVQVLKSAGRKKVAGGFLTRAPNGAEHIWKRSGKPPRKMKAGRYAGQRREPIKKLYGPSILSQYIRAAIQEAGEKVWYSRLPIELQREVDFALRKAGVIK